MSHFLYFPVSYSPSLLMWSTSPMTILFGRNIACFCLCLCLYLCLCLSVSLSLSLSLSILENIETMIREKIIAEPTMKQNTVKQTWSDKQRGDLPKENEKV